MKERTKKNDWVDSWKKDNWSSRKITFPRGCL